MSDTIYKLRRGLKLMLEHVYSPLQAFLTKVTSTGLSSSDLSTGRNTFRVSLYQPSIDHDLAIDDVAIPFVLPPLQEYFSTTGSSDRPNIKLEEVSIGFDQKGGPNGVRGRGTSVGVSSVDLASVDVVSVSPASGFNHASNASLSSSYDGSLKISSKLD